MRAVRLLPLFLFASLSVNAAAAVTVQNLRQWQAPDHTRLVFDLSAPIEHRLFTLEEPHRLVLDLDGARLAGELPAVSPEDARVAALRSGRPENGTLRVVLDLKQAVKPRSFVLKPAGDYGHRLVVDLYDAGAQPEDPKTDAPPPAPESAPGTAGKPRDVMVAIDAGHGGEDPGAVGRRYRTREKDVTLAIARELARLVDRTPGMRAVLTRRGDYYVGLRERYRAAVAARADLFISIHADALPGRQARGSSVYALSDKGASDQMARILADKENAADLIGGVNLHDKDDQVTMVLVDLAQNKAIEHSLQLGSDMLATLRRVGPVHFPTVRQAGFAVLKAPDIPSILIETAFISNPAEERQLRSSAYQRRMAQGIFEGVKRYVERNGVQGRPTLATAAPANATARRHVVRRGETLETIAARYGVHVDALRFANGLSGDMLIAGSKLLIP